MFLGQERFVGLMGTLGLSCMQDVLVVEKLNVWLNHCHLHCCSFSVEVGNDVSGLDVLT